MEGKNMVNKKEICDKIIAIYPEIGECGINVDVEWDKDKTTWVVKLERGGRKLITHLEPEDADACMEGRQCVSLGVQIEQLKDNIKQMPT
jgi:hypothetical protein